MKWRYKSLEWIHEVREKNYRKSKNLPIKELIEMTENEVKKVRKDILL